MPELPEVETSRRGIAPYLINYTIKYAIVRNTHLRWPVSEQILGLNEEKVNSVQRRAKYLLIELQYGWIIIHLGMSGSLRILHNKNQDIIGIHDHIDLIINNNMLLRYTDPRRFGAWLWCENLATSKLLAHLGPEPLSESFHGTYLYKQLRNKHTHLKPWLMDNTLVVGIGNIYANESLFSAGISPNRSASSLSLIEADLLATTIKSILEYSINKGGTTIHNFLQSDGKVGLFTKELQVYGRAGKPCYSCGLPIQSTKHRKRSTFFCYNCQH